MNIGLFNTRGINPTEHFIRLELHQLRKLGHNVELYWLRGRHPTKEEVKNMDFAIMHFVPTCLHFMRIGVPFCVLPTANDIFPDNGEKLKFVEKNNNCKFVGGQSIFHLNKYKEWEIEKPTVHIPHAVRTKLFIREKKYNPYGHYVAGGRLIPKKGIHRILRHKAGLRVFGDGPLKEELEYRYPNNKYLGYLNGKKLKSLFEKSSIYFFPAVITSDGDSDGIPNTCKEALLMNLQVIAPPIAGIPELENIFLLDDWSREGIENAISGVPKKANSIGEKYVRDNFSPEICVNKILSAIDKYSVNE